MSIIINNFPPGVVPTNENDFLIVVITPSLPSIDAVSSDDYIRINSLIYLDIQRSLS